jgi:hypothetical protein
MKKRRACDHCGKGLPPKHCRYKAAFFCSRVCKQAYLHKLKAKIASSKKR